MVERGEIEWQDDQNFEVEAVKDHIREENVSKARKRKFMS